MKIKRRTLLKSSGMTAAALSLPAFLSGCDDGSSERTGCDPGSYPLPDDLPEYAHTGPIGPLDLFAHGVASGDPLADRVILWTRVSPPTDVAVQVFWEMALDPTFERRVLAGTFDTDGSRDHTVKVDAVGLLPGITFYYRFHALGITSPVGRTRTAPTRAVSRLRFAVASCASFAHGYFHGYAKIAERDDLDAVIHLGDYIYEYGVGQYGSVRTYDPPHEIVTLDDYRRRYKLYRADAQLQAAHRQHPFICVWDDHEITNDTWAEGAENHDASEGEFSVRKAAAFQAYLEYMPIRVEVPGAIYRKIAYGGLVDLLMLDTRHHGRSLQLTIGESDSDARTMLGLDQEAWLEARLAESTARWVLLGQQVMVAQFSLDTVNHGPSNLDQWDGYAAARERLLDAIESHALGRTVVLTGDIHSSWAADISRGPWDAATYDAVTGAGSLAVEFVTPGITSPAFDRTATGEDFFGSLVLEACPHMKFGNFVDKGYIVLDVRPDKVQADWFHLDSVVDPAGAVEMVAASVAVLHGEPRLLTMDRPEAPKAAACELAP